MRYKHINSHLQTPARDQTQNTDALECAGAASHITFQRVEEGVSLRAQEGRAVVAVMFGVVVEGRVAAYKSAGNTGELSFSGVKMVFQKHLI